MESYHFEASDCPFAEDETGALVPSDAPTMFDLYVSRSYNLTDEAQGDGAAVGALGAKVVCSVELYSTREPFRSSQALRTYLLA